MFGPNRYASRLEGSKAFMKNICAQNNIPTAKFKICKNRNQVKKFLNNCSMPIVVKADGLAAGKGVTICTTKKQVAKTTSEIFNGKFIIDGEEKNESLFDLIKLTSKKK